MFWHSIPNKSTKKTVLYLRTDRGTRTLTSGGSVTHTLGVLHGLLHQGQRVVVCSSAMIPVLKKISVAQLHELRMPRCFAVFGYKLNCFFSTFFFVRSTLRAVRGQSIAYLYQRYSMLNATGLLVARIKRVPLVLEFNGSEVWVDAHWSPQKWLKLSWLIRLIERYNLRSAHRVVVVSDALRNVVAAYGVSHKKIIIVPNGVDAQRFNAAYRSHERIAVRSVHTCDDCFVFGFIGSFSYWHGIETIAQMIPALVKKQPGVHFMLLGDGPLMPYLKKELARTQVPDSAVTLTGSLDYHHAPAYLAACDAFLCPTQPNPDGSPFFGSPTKLFEYMSMGKPIIASDLEQLAQVLNPALHVADLEHVQLNNQLGILVDPHDTTGFIRAASWLIAQDNQTRVHLGVNARNKVVQQYTWDAHVNSIMKRVGS